MQRHEGTLNRSTVALDRPTVNRSTWMIPGITHKARCLSDISGDRSTTSSTSSGSGMGLSMGSLGGFGCSEDRSSLKNGPWRRTSRCSLVSSSSYSSSPSTATATTRRSSSSSTSTSSSSYRSWDSSTDSRRRRNHTSYSRRRDSFSVSSKKGNADFQSMVKELKESRRKADIARNNAVRIKKLFEKTLPTNTTTKNDCNYHHSNGWSKQNTLAISSSSDKLNRQAPCEQLSWSRRYHSIK